MLSSSSTLPGPLEQSRERSTRKRTIGFNAILSMRIAPPLTWSLRVHDKNATARTSPGGRVGKLRVVVAVRTGHSTGSLFPDELHAGVRRGRFPQVRQTLPYTTPETKPTSDARIAQ